jgi:hypothetical protein
MEFASSKIKHQPRTKGGKIQLTSKDSKMFSRGDSNSRKTMLSRVGSLLRILKEPKVKLAKILKLKSPNLLYQICQHQFKTLAEFLLKITKLLMRLNSKDFKLELNL